MRSTRAILVLSLLAVLGLHTSGIARHLHTIAYHSHTEAVDTQSVASTHHQCSHHHGPVHTPDEPAQSDDDAPTPHNEHECQTCLFLTFMTFVTQDAAMAVAPASEHVSGPLALETLTLTQGFAPRESAPRAPPAC